MKCRQLHFYNSDTLPVPLSWLLLRPWCYIHRQCIKHYQAIIYRAYNQLSLKWYTFMFVFPYIVSPLISYLFFLTLQIKLDERTSSHFKKFKKEYTKYILNGFISDYHLCPMSVHFPEMYHFKLWYIHINYLKPSTILLLFLKYVSISSHTTHSGSFTKQASGCACKHDNN